MIIIETVFTRCSNWKSYGWGIKKYIKDDDIYKVDFILIVGHIKMWRHRAREKMRRKVQKILNDCAVINE